MMRNNANWFLPLLKEQLHAPIDEANGLTPESITEEQFSGAVCKSAQDFVEKLKAQAPMMLQRRREGLRQFEDGIARIWKRPLDLLEMLLVIAIEAGEELRGEFRPVPMVDGEFALRVLMDMHSRACQVATEVLTLLNNGFPDGAHARWRTLHELSVTAHFIRDHGNDLAERYICHESVESLKAANAYQDKCLALGQEPLEEREIAQLRSERDALVKRFGGSFANEYGWASSVLCKENPTFRDIERSVGLDHIRPYYKMASYNVHASAKGIMFKLAVPPEETIALSGPSNIGFAQPGHGMAVSITQITTSLLATKPSTGRILTLRAMMTLADEIGRALLETQDYLDRSRGQVAP